MTTTVSTKRITTGFSVDQRAGNSIARVLHWETTVTALEKQLHDTWTKIAKMKAEFAAVAGNTSNSPAFVSKRSEVNARALGAPLIHVLSKSRLKRNAKVPGTEIIYMGTLNHPRVGRPLDIFTSSKDFGVMTADDGIAELGKVKNWEGHDGVNLGKSAGYEDRLFKAWKNGKGLNKWVVMPYVVLTGYQGPEKIFSGNLFDNRNEGSVTGTVRTGWKQGDAAYYWSSSPWPMNDAHLLTARLFPSWFANDNRGEKLRSIRPILAREAETLHYRPR